MTIPSLYEWSKINKARIFYTKLKVKTGFFCIKVDVISPQCFSYAGQYPEQHNREMKTSSNQPAVEDLEKPVTDDSNPVPSSQLQQQGVSIS